MQEIEKKIINNRINEVLKDWFLDDKPDYLYLKCFDKPCNMYGMFINNQGKIEIKDIVEDLNTTNYANYKSIDYFRFIKELHKHCDLYREFYNNQNEIVTVYFYKNSMTYVYGDSGNIKEIIILSDHEPVEFKKFIKEKLLKKKKESTLSTSKRWLDLGEAIERFANLPVIGFTKDGKQYCTSRIYIKEDESYYIPYLYLEDNKWSIELISTEGDGILVVNGKNIPDVIDKAWNYINNKFKNNL